MQKEHEKKLKRSKPPLPLDKKAIYRFRGPIRNSMKDSISLPKTSQANSQF